MRNDQPPEPPVWHLFVPKLVTALRQGYRFNDLRADFLAGLTVAIVALPLAMALAIASGTTPDKGLLTAVIAGFLISALGGSRYVIGGPTGAFVVVVFNVIDQQGYDGLVLATLMAGALLMLAGWARLGNWIKYIPEPVVVGFTAGIAVIIFSSQIKDLFGLTLAQVPAAVVEKWEALWQVRETVSLENTLLACGALTLIVGLKRWAPKVPGFLAAVVLASLATAFFSLPVETIGSRFGGIPTSLPDPVWPEITGARLVELLPSAFTIAFLAGIESLLCAVVADSMTGRRHRSNCELVGQGVANIASALFGGLPATGALARTATNVRSGARTPLAGIFHALFILLFMLVAAPLADFIPLASLAAVLVIVAWNMSEQHRIALILRGPWGERLVLLLTFGLTVLVDLTVAIQWGVVLAAILFMHRMSKTVRIGNDPLFEEDEADVASHETEPGDQRDDLVPGVEVLRLRGPLFFGVANRLSDVIDSIAGSPRVYILRLSAVPFIDATGAGRLREFIDRCHRHGTQVILAGLKEQPHKTLESMRVLERNPGLHLVATYSQARSLAEKLVSSAQPQR